jgi:formamidopyrimidine-DNA glycosylase
MPELPEVESARLVIQRSALDRLITDVDDSDRYVCRPHGPGEIRAALLGRRLAEVHRRGKSLWCDPAPPARPAHILGVHLGMSGKIVIADADRTEQDGGDYWERGRAPGDYRFSRFALSFSDGGRLLLVDPRRLGRVRLDPPVDRLGPDAATLTAAQFAVAVGFGDAPLKARLLDQHAIAGIGNLLADEILWRARLDPRRPVNSLTGPERTRLLRGVRSALAAALRDGGVHTLSLVPYRRVGATCPRDGAPMSRGTVGGRTTYWCSREQK